MKRVLILECGLGFGGALTSLAAFLDAVPDGSGWEFHLLTGYPQSWIRPRGALRRVGVLPRRRLYGPASALENRLRSRLGNQAGKAAFLLDMVCSHLPYALKVARYVRTHRIDLVHLNNGVLINDAGLTGAFLAKRPAVVHVRGPEYAGRTSTGLAKLACRFMPVSRFIAETVSRLGVSADRMDIVPEGLDAEAFREAADGESVRNELGLPADAPVVGMVGCLVPWKGHAVFLDACAEVLKSHPAVFLIAGDSPDPDSPFPRFLNARAEERGVAENVRFLGHREDVASVMDACDVVVHASTSPEPFGRVILEAMALGKPVIATRGGGPSEVIAEGEDGLLVPPGDPSAMAAAIGELIERPDSRERLGRAGKRKAEELYSISRHARKILRRYRNTMEN